MSQAVHAPLYSPEILGLAVELAYYPFDASATLTGAARSLSCGSTLDVSLVCGSSGRIEAVGLKVAACAIGQASAAIFARHASGSDREALTAMAAEVSEWLAGERRLPDWPDLALIAPALRYPARHGAIMLPWKAAEQALSKAESCR